MAREIVINSDVSGTPNAQTYTISWDGQTWEVDLTEAEAEPIRALATKGRQVDTGGRPGGGGTRGLDRRIRNKPNDPL